MLRHHRSAFFSTAATLAGIALLVGCESIAGVASRKADPIISANSLPGTGGVPSLGNGRIRIADLAITPGNIDFCVKLSSESSWGRPIMANSGTDSFFRGGLTYPQVTIPFSAPVGKIDVKFIAAGDSCSGATISQGTGITVGQSLNLPAGAAPAPVVTIVRYGGTTGAADGGIPPVKETVVGLPEEVSTNPTCAATACARLRIVNSADWAESINFGATQNSATALPAIVPSALLQTPIPPGGVPPVQTTTTVTSPDTSGYVGTITSGVTGQGGFKLGIVAEDSTPTQAVAVFAPSASVDTQSLFLIGQPGNNAHPIQGLLVEDDKPATGPADAGIDYQFLAQASLTTPSTIAVDVLNVALYGLQSPYGDLRRQAILLDLPARPSDVQCIVEIDSDADKQALKGAAANGNFPYAYWVPTTDLTPATNPADWFGNTPAEYTQAPCASEDPAKIDAVVSCAASCSVSCSTGSPCSSPGDEDASISSLNCLETECLSAIGQLYVESPPNWACIDCLEQDLGAKDPIAGVAANCQGGNLPYGDYTFGGANMSLILSKFPFAKKADGTDDTEAFLFPGSNFHHAALRARLSLDPNDSSKVVDFYCAQLISPDVGSAEYKYAGQYATPDAGLYATEATADNGWEDEQNLQARDLVQWVQSQSGTTPAIVAGDWHASLPYTTDAGVAVLEAHSSEVIAQFSLDAGLVPAHPTNYTPDCNYCNSNPIASTVSPDALGYDFFTVFLYKFPPNSTIADTVWGNDPTAWTTQLPDDAGAIPLSPYYPRLVQVFQP